MKPCCTNLHNCLRVIAVHLQLVPFLLEDKLKELGGNFKRTDDWKPLVVTDGNLITGQNPASAKSVGEAILKYLQEKRSSVGGTASGGVTFSAGEVGLVKKGEGETADAPAGAGATKA